jgi:hypothetical protein
MRLLPMKGMGTGGRTGEPVYSLMAGVPSLAIGLMGLVLIASYLIDRPVGPPQFYLQESFAVVPEPPAKASRLREGLPPAMVVSLPLPSGLLLSVLFAGAACGAIGMIIADRLGSVRKAKTSIAGVIANGLAFLLAWISCAVAATY